MKLQLTPLKLREANALVAQWHRHHRPVVGARFSIGVERGGALVGAAIVGRPVARMLDEPRTAEVLRLVTDGTPNACSMLYGAAWRAWRAMGGTRLVTYILAEEPGTSLRAAGWTLVDDVAGGGSWSREARPRESQPHLVGLKQRWEMRSC